jgi:hypothetical protein
VDERREGTIRSWHTGSRLLEKSKLTGREELGFEAAAALGLVEALEEEGDCEKDRAREVSECGPPSVPHFQVGGERWVSGLSETETDGASADSRLKRAIRAPPSKGASA